MEKAIRISTIQLDIVLHVESDADVGAAEISRKALDAAVNAACEMPGGNCQWSGDVKVVGSTIVAPGSRVKRKPITERQWRENEDKLSAQQEGLHPCDHWNHEECFCKGACSCHWSEEPKEGD